MHDHRGRFTVPTDNGELSVTFLGVSTLLFDDGQSALMTDGFFTRPSLLRVAVGKVAPDPARIDTALSHAGIGHLEAVVCVHSHYDHALDSALVAARTRAQLVGGESTRNVGIGADLMAKLLTSVAPDAQLAFGNFSLTFLESAHAPGDRYTGKIDAPISPPVRQRAFRCGEAWSILFRHTSGHTALVQGSGGFIEGSLHGQQADVAYLGVGLLGLLGRKYLEAYWENTVRAVQARRVILIHWDDLFRPLPEPEPARMPHQLLRALPYAVDDLDFTLEVLDRLATDDGVDLHLPTVWQRENPWHLLS